MWPIAYVDNIIPTFCFIALTETTPTILKGVACETTMQTSIIPPYPWAQDKSLNTSVTAVRVYLAFN